MYILVVGKYSKFVSKNKIIALSVCFPQTSWSAGRMFSASTSRLIYYRRIVSVSPPGVQDNKENEKPNLKRATWIVTFTNEPCLT